MQNCGHRKNPGIFTRSHQQSGSEVPHRIEILFLPGMYWPAKIQLATELQVSYSPGRQENHNPASLYQPYNPRDIVPTAGSSGRIL